MFVWDDHCGFEVVPDEPLRPLLQPWLDANVAYLSINAYYDPLPWTRAVENIAALRCRLPIEVPEIQIISSAREIDDAYANRKMAVTFDSENQMQQRTPPNWISLTAIPNTGRMMLPMMVQ